MSVKQKLKPPKLVPGESETSAVFEKLFLPESNDNTENRLVSFQTSSIRISNLIAANQPPFPMGRPDFFNKVPFENPQTE